MTVMSNLYFSSVSFWVLIESTFALNLKQLKQIIFLVFVLFYCGCCFHAVSDCFLLRFPQLFLATLMRIHVALFSWRMTSLTGLETKEELLHIQPDQAATIPQAKVRKQTWLIIHSDYWKKKKKFQRLSEIMHAYFRPFGRRTFVRVPFGRFSYTRTFPVILGIDFGVFGRWSFAEDIHLISNFSFPFVYDQTFAD